MNLKKLGGLLLILFLLSLISATKILVQFNRVLDICRKVALQAFNHILWNFNKILIFRQIFGRSKGKTYEEVFEILQLSVMFLGFKALFLGIFHQESIPEKKEHLNSAWTFFQKVHQESKFPMELILGFSHHPEILQAVFFLRFT